MKSQFSKANLQFPSQMQTAENHFSGFNHNRKRRLKQLNTRLCSQRDEDMMIALQAGKKLKVNYKYADHLYEIKTVFGNTLDMSPSLNFTMTEANKYVTTNPKTNQQFRFVGLKIYKHIKGFKFLFHSLPANTR